MHFKKGCRKGFTLIEILIVVVILAVLASMILPRMLQQSERAKLASAFTLMGVFRRAAEKNIALTGGAFSYFYGSGDNVYWGSAKDWGVKEPLGFQDWTAYAYTSGDNAYVGIWDNTNGSSMSVSSSGGSSSWWCDGTYFKDKTDSGGLVVGCTI
ncbi:MAG: type II secretion system protein [Candidatus Omnitrophica bacterium]|nr:type II secretion system protein [Candidatus Omnitrophota bacterium]